MSISISSISVLVFESWVASLVFLFYSRRNVLSTYDFAVSILALYSGKNSRLKVVKWGCMSTRKWGIKGVQWILQVSQNTISNCVIGQGMCLQLYRKISAFWLSHLVWCLACFMLTGTSWNDFWTPFRLAVFTFKNVCSTGICVGLLTVCLSS